jgi:hypothetical protein
MGHPDWPTMNQKLVADQLSPGIAIARRLSRLERIFSESDEQTEERG